MAYTPRGFWFSLRVITLAALALAGSRPVLGQQTTGSVTGSVQDSSGAAIVGTSVRLTNTGTGISQVTASDGSGNFQFLLLPPGNYSLEATQQGFRTFRREGIVVEADRSLAVPVTLSVGQVTETIEVIAGTPLLEPNTSALGTVMDTMKIQDLPLNGRNPMGLANLIPTVRGVGFFGGQVLSSWRTAAVNIGGGQPVANGFMIDGMANDKIGDAAGAMTFLALEATQEFKVLTNNMSAEFGRTGGGIISVVSKSGTNEYHGNAFEYLRADNLNANDFFANSSGAKRAPLTFNQFGGSLGGPVKKDKAFFFFNYERYEERRTQTRVINSPTALERSGNFSDTRTSNGQLITIYDPLTTVANPAQPGTFIRQAFQGNVIPANRVSTLARKTFELYPAGNLPGLPFTRAQNLYQAGSTPITRWTWGLKGDYQMNHGRLAVRYTRDVIDPWFFANFFGPGNILEDDYRHIIIPRHSASLQYTSTITPTFLLDTKLGYNYDGERGNGPWSEPFADKLSLTDFGFPKAFADQLQRGHFTPRGGFPQINVGDLTNLAGHSDQIRTGSAWVGAASVTKIAGPHNIKTGYEYRFYTFNSTGVGIPTFNFNRGFTQGPNPSVAGANSGYGVASFVLGMPATGNNQYNPDISLGQHYHALFVQEDWKTTRRLTLNLGLRWEYEAPLTERYDAFTGFDPALASPLRVPGLTLRGGTTYVAAGGSRGFTDPAWGHWGPRLGFAFQARRNLVARGAYGITYIPTKGQGIPLYTGFQSTTNMASSIDGGLTPQDTVSNPFPNGVDLPSGSRLGAVTGVGSNINTQLRDVKPGYFQQWNMTLQYEPWDNWLLEGAYVGSKGTHLLTIEGRNLNQLHPSYLGLGNQLVQSVANPFFGAINTGTLSGRTITQQQLLLPFPQYTGVSGGWSFLGDSIYHAFALKIEKRFSRGVSMLAAYTASKLIDGASGSNGMSRPGGTSNSSILNWYNLRAERSKGIEDMPQRLVLTALWELPFLKTATGWKQHVLGGWQINTIATIEKGRPIALTAPGTPGVIGNNRPDVVAGQQAKLDNPTIGRWFNTDAFRQSAAYTFGNASRTIPNVMSDGVFNIDLSLFKNFPITERVRLELRGEAFNLANTPTFETPDRVLNSRTFGVVTASAFAPKPREVQLALQLRF